GDIRYGNITDTQNGVRVCGRDPARVVLAGAAVRQLKPRLERMRRLDPAQRVGELHQRARIKPRGRSGPAERRIVSKSKRRARASDGAGLGVEQFPFELRKCGQRFLRRGGDIAFGGSSHTASDIEWGPAEPAVALHSPSRFVENGGRDG